MVLGGFFELGSVGFGSEEGFLLLVRGEGQGLAIDILQTLVLGAGQGSILPFTDREVLLEFVLVGGEVERLSERGGGWDDVGRGVGFGEGVTLSDEVGEFLLLGFPVLEVVQELLRVGLGQVLSFHTHLSSILITSTSYLTPLSCKYYSGSMDNERKKTYFDRVQKLVTRTCWSECKTDPSCIEICY